MSSALTGAAAQPSAPQPQRLSPRSSRKRRQHPAVSAVSILAVVTVAWYCGLRQIFIDLPMRETHTETLLSLAGSLPKACSSQAWAGPELGAGSWSQGFHGVVGAWQFEHHPCFPGCALAGGWAWEPELGVEPMHAEMGPWGLNCQHCPLSSHVLHESPCGVSHLALRSSAF